MSRRDPRAGAVAMLARGIARRGHAWVAPGPSAPVAAVAFLGRKRECVSPRDV